MCVCVRARASLSLSCSLLSLTVTAASPEFHPVFLLFHPSLGDLVREREAEREEGEEGRTISVGESATPRMTQVPQSLTRLRLFCHLLLSFELFYRLPR